VQAWTSGRTTSAREKGAKFEWKSANQEQHLHQPFNHCASRGEEVPRAEECTLALKQKTGPGVSVHRRGTLCTSYQSPETILSDSLILCIGMAGATSPVSSKVPRSNRRFCTDPATTERVQWDGIFIYTASHAKHRSQKGQKNQQKLESCPPRLKKVAQGISSGHTPTL
jgi:hypothetical protein